MTITRHPKCSNVVNLLFIHEKKGSQNVHPMTLVIYYTHSTILVLVFVLLAFV